MRLIYTLYFTEVIMSKYSSLTTPIYSRIWNRLKGFPQFIQRGARNPPQTSSSAAAFLISGGMGVLIMMIMHHLADTSPAVEVILTNIGNLTPGSISGDLAWGKIGSYGGKEACLLISWLVSLSILYPLLKNRQIKPRTIFLWMFGLYTLSTAMAWHPLFPYLSLN
jgi:hypothetical protein